MGECAAVQGQLIHNSIYPGNLPTEQRHSKQLSPSPISIVRNQRFAFRGEMFQVFLEPGCPYLQLTPHARRCGQKEVSQQRGQLSEAAAPRLESNIRVSNVDSAGHVSHPQSRIKRTTAWQTLYFTPRPKTGLQPRGCEPDLFGALAVYDGYRTGVL